MLGRVLLKMGHTKNVFDIFVALLGLWSSGMDARLSRERSRVQIPSTPLVCCGSSAR